MGRCGPSLSIGAVLRCSARRRWRRRTSCCSPVLAATRSTPMNTVRSARSSSDGAMHTRLGLPESGIVWLGEDSTAQSPMYHGRATLENVQHALGQLAQSVKPGEQVVLVLIGHGQGDGPDSKFGNPGPHITATNFAQWMNQFKAQRTAFIDLTDASGDMLPVLSDSNRVVITATKSSYERNETVFVKYFIDAFAQDGADVDKDGRVSLLEAYQYAATETKRSYDNDNRLMTEHAQLDDEGAKKGTSAPDGRTGEGMLARRFFLDAGPAARAAASDPQLAKLYADQFNVEEQIDALKHKKATMAPDAYDDQLEQILLSLARTSREIRRLEGRGGGGL